MKAMGRKKEHKWDFMGNDTKGRGDLSRCDLCKQWRWTDGKPFKMKPEVWQNMLDTKEIIGY